MGKDYIPGSDNDFLSWMNNFIAYINAHIADLGLVAGDILPIGTAFADFDSKLLGHVGAQQAAQSSRQAKDDSRDALETVVRQLVRRLQASPDVDDAERAAMGITVPDSTPSAPAGGGISSRPVGVVDTSQRLRHEIRFADENTPTRRAKPAGVMGCEIWVKVTASGEAPPASASELSFLTLDTASPYVAEYDGANGGKTAHYMLRWVTTGGDKGPWSETVSATIAA